MPKLGERKSLVDIELELGQLIIIFCGMETGGLVFNRDDIELCRTL